MDMYFVGVDLAWSPARMTGVAVAQGGKDGARLTAWQADLRGYEAVAEYIREQTATAPATVAIDAPLVVPNRDSIRGCDRSVNADFRQFHAGVYPANRSLLSRYGRMEGERLREALLGDAYVDAVPLGRRGAGRTLFETYPHAAMVALFRLPERLPYKARGRNRPWTVRATAFEAYRALLRGLRKGEPSLDIPSHILAGSLDEMKERGRKEYEDLLDAVFCAYMALYGWYWGPSRCRVYGSVPGGYMILPRLGGGPEPRTIRGIGGSARRGT